MVASKDRFGAQKWISPGSAIPGMHFEVWAPHAKNVEVVFAPFDVKIGNATGYIADHGTGIDLAAAVEPLISKGNLSIPENGSTVRPLPGTAGILHQLRACQLCRKEALISATSIMSPASSSFWLPSITASFTLIFTLFPEAASNPL
jgi:hypothetical protein